MSDFDPLRTFAHRPISRPLGFVDLLLLFPIAFLLLTVLNGVRFARRWCRGTRNRRELVLGISSIAAAVNFFSLVLMNVLLGGDAFSGRIEAGHYYLGSHGTYTEVSQRVFVYSACH